MSDSPAAVFGSTLPTHPGNRPAGIRRRAARLGRADLHAAGRRRVSGRADDLSLRAGPSAAHRSADSAAGWTVLADSPLAADPHSDAGTTIRQLRREYEKRVQAAAVAGRGIDAGLGAGPAGLDRGPRKNNDFAAFQPLLGEDLRPEAAAGRGLGYPDEPYDALLDDYEPEAKTARRGARAGRSARGIGPAGGRDRRQRAAAAGRDPAAPTTRRRPRRRSARRPRPRSASISSAAGWTSRTIRSAPAWGRTTAASPPATTSGSSPPRSSASCTKPATGCTTRACGAEQYGLPPGTYVSLGIHESQSRLWENVVGRSRAFWQHFFPQAQRQFPDGAGRRAAGRFYFAINDVRPSLIRVEADEATYNLHIVIRFELERALLRGDLPVARPAGGLEREVPRSTWASSRPTTRDGVLQDIHWSAGLVGLLPHLHAGQPVRGPVLPAGGSRPGRPGRRRSPAASSRRFASGCARTSTTAASATPRRNWSSWSPAAPDAPAADGVPPRQARPAVRYLIPRPQRIRTAQTLCVPRSFNWRPNGTDILDAGDRHAASHGLFMGRVPGRRDTACHAKPCHTQALTTHRPVAYYLRAA